MKHFKLLTYFLILSSCLYNSVWASEPKPEKCPDVTAIQQELLDVVSTGPGNAWLVGKMGSHYDTQNRWIFSVSVPKNQFPDKDEAKAKANEALSTLSFRMGPSSFGTSWLCFYNIGLGEGVAIAEKR